MNDRGFKYFTDLSIGNDKSDGTGRERKRVIFEAGQITGQVKNTPEILLRRMEVIISEIFVDFLYSSRWESVMVSETTLLVPVKMLSFEIRRQPVMTAKQRLGLSFKKVRKEQIAQAPFLC